MPKTIITRAAKPATKAPKAKAKAPTKQAAKKPAGEAKANVSATRAATFAAFTDKALYAGPSPNFNRGRSTTAIEARNISSYTYRLDCQLRELIALYGNKPFSRGQHGDVNRLLGNANIAKLNGDGTLQLTALAIAAAGKLKPLADGDSIPLASFHEHGKRA